jgi:hypothetical protein
MSDKCNKMLKFVDVTLCNFDKIIIYMQVAFKRSAKLSLVFTACSDQQMHQ